MLMRLGKLPPSRYVGLVVLTDQDSIIHVLQQNSVLIGLSCQFLSLMSVVAIYEASGSDGDWARWLNSH